MHRPTTAPSSLLAALSVAALLLAGCGTSAGSTDQASDDKTTTTASSDDPTTTAAGGDGEESTTTGPDDEGEDPGDGPSLDELEGILPTAADLGSGWGEVPAESDDGDDEDDPFGAAVEESCPSLLEFAGEDEDGDSVEVEFENDLDQSINVTLSVDAEERDADELSGVIDALNDCGEISYTDDDGMETSFTFTGDVTSEFGDQGVQVQGDVSIWLPEMGDPIEFSMYFVSYRMGTVGVSVQGIDGIDSQTMKINSLDPSEVLLDLAAQVEEAIGSL